MNLLRTDCADFIEHSFRSGSVSLKRFPNSSLLNAVFQKLNDLRCTKKLLQLI